MEVFHKLIFLLGIAEDFVFSFFEESILKNELFPLYKRHRIDFFSIVFKDIESIYDLLDIIFIEGFGSYNIKSFSPSE